MILLDTMRRATFALEALFQARHPGLTSTQYQILVAINANEGKTQTELVEIAGIDRSSVSDVCVRLSKDGLIKRVVDKNDRRALCVFMTEPGRIALKKAQRIMGELQEELLKSGVSLDVLIKRLDAIVKLKSDADSAAPAPGPAPRRAARS